MSICRGVAGARGRNPTGIMMHNDAGSEFANAEHYRNTLPQANLENGFAHYYVASDGILQAEDDAYMTWHSGNDYYNAQYLSIESCQSYGDLSVFLQNEERALKLAADKCKQYGITPNENTIMLHQEVYPTACPHRSVEIHGGLYETKKYYIRKIKEYMMKGKWIKDKVGWWWKDPDGSYPKNCWMLIDGDYYYFKSNGYAACNEWVDYNGDWYWVNADCKMVKGWKKLSGVYYYFNENLNAFPPGAMVYNLFVKWKGKRYYLKDNGYMAKSEELTISGRKYKFNSSGEVTVIK